ncbi:hypothetical protein R1flu_023298 [Riccia fluitans]|uniref:UDP-glucose 4-epimerase n=1 Tax=Riccia fluitans TaxID=41844 RepID=A0ABD1XUN9_9MARC
MTTHHYLRRMLRDGNQRDSEKWILVTGGAGYIGSHTALELLLEGYKVVIVDNLDNSDEEAVKRVGDLAGKNKANLHFFIVDICNRDALSLIFQKFRFDAVIHFAGLKAVGESVAKPSHYYTNNLIGTLNLLDLMADVGCKKLVFSSSATVYGQPKSVPCTEDFPVQALNPYGRTKLFIEEITRDLQKADPEWRIILLRYFNPVGAHPSGLIGEDPRGIPNNLMPYVQQVAVGRLPQLTIFGSDYNTRDGTGVRDYIHVQDLATGHIAALQKLFSTKDIGCIAINLGTGRGTSVLEMVAAFEKACCKKLPVRIADRRPGDASELYAATEKAERELGWKAQKNIDDMCRDQWNWASKNPWGYRPPQNVVIDGNDIVGNVNHSNGIETVCNIKQSNRIDTVSNLKVSCVDG